jgi:hypothetical protein
VSWKFQTLRFSGLTFLCSAGKVVRSQGVCYIAWGGKEHGKSNYEILEGTAKWIRFCGTSIPASAIRGLFETLSKISNSIDFLPSGGRTEDGETLYIGRANHQGTLTVGKIQPSHGVCYISFDGMEIAFLEFDILVE